MRALATAMMSRLLTVERRVTVWEETTFSREMAVDAIVEDTADLLPVLNSLVVGAAIIIGGGEVAHNCVHRDFRAIVRKAAFRRAADGRDATELNEMLDDEWWD